MRTYALVIKAYCDIIDNGEVINYEKLAITTINFKTLKDLTEFCNKAGISFKFSETRK